jgi:biotin carboxyl carrier protein
MPLRASQKLLLAAVFLGAAAALAFSTREIWLEWLLPTQPGAAAEAHHGAPERVRLSPQARANLKLVARPIQLGAFTRTLTIPGVVVDRPGKSDRVVTTPIAGIVTSVAAVPGDTIRPGDPLFTIKIISESLQTSQTELFKASRELQITAEQKTRLEKAGAGVVAEVRIAELDYQMRRLVASAQALRYDLSARGLTPPQIQGVAEGKFVTEFVVRVPGKETATGSLPTAVPLPEPPAAEPVTFEIHDLKVQQGEQVQAGQTLCVLAQHQHLYVEGAVFAREVPLLERAAQQRWQVQVEVAGESENWPPLSEPLKVQFLANRASEASQTIPFYIPLHNQFREHGQDGRMHRLWRFRPGQRVRLLVPVEQFKDVFVLPLEAVAREGLEAYVFRANGDAFDRRAVHIIYEDRRHAVIANDGSINDGNHIARSGAAQLNRALKAAAAGEAGGGHHGHSHDH